MKKLTIVIIAIAFLVIGASLIYWSYKFNEHLEGRWYEDFYFCLMTEDFNYSSDDKIHLQNFVFYYDFTQNKGSISFDLKDKNWSLAEIKTHFPSVVLDCNIYTTKIGEETHEPANIDAKPNIYEPYDDLRKINWTYLNITEFNRTFNNETFVIEFKSADLKPKGWFGFWYDSHNQLHSVNFILGDRYECTGACVYDLDNIEETPNSFVRNLKLNFIRENKPSSFKLDAIDRNVKWFKTLLIGLGFFFMGVPFTIIGLLYKERKERSLKIFGIFLPMLVKLGDWGKTSRRSFLAAMIVALITFIIGSLYDLYKDKNPFTNPTTLTAFVILITSVVLLVPSTEGIYNSLAKKLTKSRFRNPKIAILSDGNMDEKETKDLLRSTVFEPKDWYNSLHLGNFSVEITKDLSMRGDCSIILNPFGELYPEEDTTNLKTFQRIKEYIKNGGVFINTASLAFFYMWNPKTKIEGLTGPMVEFYKGMATTKPIYFERILDSSIMLWPSVNPDDSPITDTWLYKNFGVRTTLNGVRPLEAKGAEYFDDFIDASTKVQEFRSALRCEITEAQLIPIIRCEYLYHPTGRKHECYPIAAVKYGRGYLILVGMVLTENKDFAVVIKVIGKIAERLRKEGSLEHK